MPRLFLVFAASAAACLFLTPLARRLARRRGSLDAGDGERKLQPAPVPYFGGLALHAALIVGVLAGFYDGGWRPADLSFPLALVASATWICLVGWCDDEFVLRVRWKLLGQVIATLPLVLTGHVLQYVEFCGWVCDLQWWSLPVTMIWLVAGANALNFIDGIDGLAATVGLVIAAATAVIASHLGNDSATLLAVVLAGGLAGFLQYNWQPATIYLGDAGSMTIGLWLAALALAGSRDGTIGSRAIVPLCLLFAPLADVALAVLRRLLSCKRFWLPDRGHIHHRLLDRGVGVGRTVMLLAAITGATCSLAFASAVHGRELLGWGALAMLLVGLVRLDLLGRPEMELLRNRIVAALLRWCSTRSSDRGRWAHSKASRGGSPFENASPAAVWAMLTADLEPLHVERLEMTITTPAGCQSRYAWHRYGADSSHDEWAVEAQFQASEKDGGHGSCRFRAALTADGAMYPLNWLSVADVFRHYGPYWAVHGEYVPQVGLAVRAPSLERFVGEAA